MKSLTPILALWRAAWRPRAARLVRLAQRHLCPLAPAHLHRPLMLRLADLERQA